MVRLDAGDGLATHPYVDYHYTVSVDGGRTWPRLLPMAGTGCARPRLLQLGGGFAPLLMSGGRMKNNGSDDNLLWVGWRGSGYPAYNSSKGFPSWERYAVCYRRNLPAKPGPKHLSCCADLASWPGRRSPTTTTFSPSPARRSSSRR